MAYTPAAELYSLRVADVTGDGRPDILAVEGTTEITAVPDVKAPRGGGNAHHPVPR